MMPACEISGGERVADDHPKPRDDGLVQPDRSHLGERRGFRPCRRQRRVPGHQILDLEKTPPYMAARLDDAPDVDELVVPQRVAGADA